MLFKAILGDWGKGIVTCDGMWDEGFTTGDGGIWPPGVEGGAMVGNKVRGIYSK